MRFGYLLPRLIILGAIWAFFAFAFDPLLRLSLVAGGEALRVLDSATVALSLAPSWVIAAKAATPSPSNKRTLSTSSLLGTSFATAMPE